MFFEMFLRDIRGVPRFDWFWLSDRNPLSGHTKRRRIYNPNGPMREIHRRFISWLRSLRIPMPNATGSVRGMSPLRNVLRHKAHGKKMKGRTPFRRYFFLMDISSAYQHVNPDSLAAVIWHHNKTLPGNEQEVLKLLQEYFLCAEDGGLVVGGPASPDLFNLYCEELLDKFLRPLCSKYALTYSRYLDDLTFSSDRPIGPKKRRILRKMVERLGFRISDKKAEVLDLKKGPATVNGVGITRDGRIFLPRHALSELRGLLHLALTGKKEISAHRIHGKMSVFKAVTDFSRQNQTERRVVEMYAMYRQKEKQARHKIDTVVV